MGWCLLPKRHFLLPQLETGYWPRGLLCISGRAFLTLSYACQFPPDSTYFFQHARSSFRRPLLGAMWWTVWDDTEKDYVGLLYWRRSCLVLSWMGSLPSGPVALLGPSSAADTAGMLHVVCSSQSMCTMKRGSNGARPAGQGKRAGAGWSHSALGAR